MLMFIKLWYKVTGSSHKIVLKHYCTYTIWLTDKRYMCQGQTGCGQVTSHSLSLFPPPRFLTADWFQLTMTFVCTKPWICRLLINAKWFYSLQIISVLYLCASQVDSRIIAKVYSDFVLLSTMLHIVVLVFIARMQRNASLTTFWRL